MFCMLRGNENSTVRPVSASMLARVMLSGRTPMRKIYPDGYNCGDECLINAINTEVTNEHQDLYPGVADPGAQATMDAVEGVTGLTVNYYVLIDLKGFQHLVDAVDGITLDVGRRVPIGGGSSRITGWIEPGKNKHLDGYHALWFARSREGSSDYERMARQRCVMTAMLQQVNPQTMLTKFRDVAKASAQVVSTDIPEADLGTFVELALLAKKEKVTSVQFVPPLITPSHPDFAKVRRLVASAIAKSEKPAKAKASGTSGATGSASTGSSSSTAGPGGGSAAGDEPVDAKAVCQAVS
jgi:LCP family protein required for cell wall assembly